MRTFYHSAGGAVVAAALLAFAHSGLAAGNFEYQFGNVFSGRAPTPANGPWIDARFESTSPGTVRLTICDTGFATGESVENLYFNLNPKLTPEKLKFTVVGETGDFKLPVIATGLNRFNVAGQGKFDIGLTFSEDYGAGDCFGAGESLVLQISGIPNLTASDFTCRSTPAARGCNTSYTAADVRGAGAASSWIEPSGVTPFVVIPEPAPGLLIALGAGIMMVVAGERRVQQKASGARTR